MCPYIRLYISSNVAIDESFFSISSKSDSYDFCCMTAVSAVRSRQTDRCFKNAYRLQHRPHDGGSKHILKVGQFLRVHTEQHLRRQPPSHSHFFAPKQQTSSLRQYVQTDVSYKPALVQVPQTVWNYRKTLEERHNRPMYYKPELTLSTKNGEMSPIRSTYVFINEFPSTSHTQLASIYIHCIRSPSTAQLSCFLFSIPA